MGRRSKRAKQRAVSHEQQLAKKNASKNASPKETPTTAPTEPAVASNKSEATTKTPETPPKEDVNEEPLDEEALKRQLLETFKRFMRKQPPIPEESIQRAKTDHTRRVDSWLSELDDLALQAAVLERRVDLAAVALLRNANPNGIIPEKGLSYLHAATEANQVDMMRLLLENGAVVNSFNSDGDTALHAASQKNLLEGVKLLIENRADVNYENQKGQRSLHLALLHASGRVCAALVEAGADVNAKGPPNDSKSLDLAVQRVESSGASHLSVVKLLVKYGATLSHWQQRKLLLKCHRAVAKNIKGLVQLYLDNGCDPNGYVNMTTPMLLGAAAKLGHVEIGELLLDRGARLAGEPSAMNDALLCGHARFADLLFQRAANGTRLGVTRHRCLELAAMGSCTDINQMKELIQVLIRHGISLDTTSGPTSNTVLHEAVRRQRTDSIRVLLEMGADANLQNIGGMTPLLLACHRNAREAAKILVESGKADLHCTAVDGSHALLEAVSNENESLTELLLAKGAPVNLAKLDGITPLTLAVSKSNTVIAKMLLAAGADGFSPDGSLTIAAVEAEDLDVLRLSIRSGADANKTDANGDLPLCVASKGNKTAIVSLLLEAGADANLKDGHGATPLILAIRNSCFETTRILLRSGKADLHCAASDGSHPLYEAVEQGSRQLVMYLLSKGARSDLIGKEGWTPLQLAASKSDTAIAKMLLDAGADVACEGGRLIKAAIFSDDHDMFKFLLSAGANVHQEDDRGDLPLVTACKGNKLVSATLLLEAGASVNGNPDADETPLTAAVTAGADDSLVELLLDAGAYPDFINSAGNTALHIAASAGRAGLVRRLLKHGANPFIRDASMMSAQDVAQHHGYDKIGDLVAGHRQSLFCQNVDAKGDVAQWMSRGAKSRGVSRLATSMEKLFLCPITLEIMEDPVFAPDGHSYERSAITKWLELHGQSPLTHQRMKSSQLIPNWNLKQQTELYLKGGNRSCSESSK